jgi:hypothetical protein
MTRHFLVVYCMFTISVNMRVFMVYITHLITLLAFHKVRLIFVLS